MGVNRYRHRKVVCENHQSKHDFVTGVARDGPGSCRYRVYVSEIDVFFVLALPKPTAATVMEHQRV